MASPFRLSFSDRRGTGWAAPSKSVGSTGPQGRLECHRGGSFLSQPPLQERFAGQTVRPPLVAGAYSSSARAVSSAIFKFRANTLNPKNSEFKYETPYTPTENCSRLLMFYFARREN
jgi:hypothetical protein